ncbi:hypothetical protein [uncultured Roseobacter sp.]|uniref:hypothetical protein n=1 Tax=uncultured Roseobacter sp. TaxID=114847 RepID=UPI00262664DC|nr:hypothetical protein [uncultured Roseobacter sp.]
MPNRSRTKAWFQRAAHWQTQAILVSVAAEAAVSDPVYLSQIKMVGRQGAAASGTDLAAFDLAEAGFVLRR